MTDPDLQKKDPADPAQASEPVVSKPYIMPDDPEPGSVETLTREVAEARDKMLRTLAQIFHLPQCAQHLVARLGDLLALGLDQARLRVVGHDIGF